LVVEQLIAGWGATPKKVVHTTIEKYGPPNEATPSRLIWFNTGPWKRTIVYRDEVHVRQMRALDVRETLRVAPELPGLRGLPARVIWGTDDQFQKLEYGERLARDLGVQLERIDGGKHFTPEDHPEPIAAALRGLIEEVERIAPTPTMHATGREP
jgi:pimeloyl-ACP methyl ester carboxylesterase